MKRRVFLKKSLIGSAMALTAGYGLLRSVVATALEWPKTVFDQETEADAVKALFGDTPIVESADVVIKAPLQAENGAVVPIKVTTARADAESIAIMVEKNPVPYITSVNLGQGSSGFYSARIKMGETSKVSCYVKAGNEVLMAAQEIKVTVGGCGG